MEHQCLQLRRHLGAQLTQCGGRFADVPVQQAERGRRPERRLAREHLVQHAAERVEVAARVGGGGEGLFGGHVGGAADRGAGEGEPGRVGVQRGGDPEVEHHHPAVVPDHHVARLEVPVHHRDGVHHGERGTDLRGDGDRRGDREGVLLGQQVGEAQAPDALHHEVQLAGVLPRVQHGDQPGVVERGGDPALAEEAAAQVVAAPAAGGRRGRGQQVGTEQLDGDPPVQAFVVGRPDLAHAAVADLLGEAVPAVDDARLAHGRRSWT